MTIEFELGKAAHFQRQGNHTQATKLYQKILKINPEIPIAHYNLALIHKAQKKHSAAEKSFKLAIKYNPQYALAWNGYVRALSERGKKKEALRVALQAAKNQNHSAESCQIIADQLQISGSEKMGSMAQDALLFCLDRRDIDFDGTIHAALAFLKEHAVLGHIFSGPISKDTPNFINSVDPLKVINALLEPLPAKIIANLILPTHEAECGLIHLREILKLASDGIDPLLRVEACALIALQMDLREYSIYSTAYDARDVSQLLPSIELAMFQALTSEAANHIFNQHNLTLKKLPLSSCLLERQGIATLKRDAIRSEIPYLTEIKDKTSLRMQTQYEESPYPRWFGLRHGGSEELPSLVSRLFPHISIPAPTPTTNILVAGCGTGRHALRTAVRIKNSSVTAVDLSKNSLAYGFTKSQQLSIKNIQFLQADINQLPTDMGPFDLIECCGVLHHMAEPATAWSRLRQLLKPNGLMKIALYSEIARQDVLAAQSYLKLDPLTLSVEDIKTARCKILDLTDDHKAKSVSKELDFYSISGCRDFLFNQQETRYTLLEIQGILSDLKLEFLGFEFTDPSIILEYKSAFPKDITATNLENWHRIEEQNPRLFRGMYQFWCRPLSRELS